MHLYVFVVHIVYFIFDLACVILCPFTAGVSIHRVIISTFSMKLINTIYIAFPSLPRAPLNFMSPDPEHFSEHT